MVETHREIRQQSRRRPPEIDGVPVGPLMTLPFSEHRPDFVPAVDIETQADRIAGEVSEHILAGLEAYSGKRDLGDVIQTKYDEKLWLLALRSSKYQAAYQISRRDAQREADFAISNSQALDRIGSFLDETGATVPILNYAVHHFGNTFDQTEGRTTITGTHIPPFAIETYDKDTIGVNASNYLDRDPALSLELNEEIYDFHDFGHMLAASSSNGKFGVKYHTGLPKLGQFFPDIIADDLSGNIDGPRFSNNMFFFQLSKPIYDYYEAQRDPAGRPVYSEEDIHTKVTEELFAYMNGDHPLFHPGLRISIQGERPIDPVELAIGEQMKRYERRAGEVERELFVRGTPGGSSGRVERDLLLPLTRSQRIVHIAGLGEELTYFEARNLHRHRAHEDALGEYANYLLSKRQAELKQTSVEDERLSIEEDIDMLEATVTMHQLDDLKSGHEIDMYSKVADILEQRSLRAA